MFLFFNYKIRAGGVDGKINRIRPVNFVNVHSIRLCQDISSCHLQLVIVSTAVTSVQSKCIMEGLVYIQLELDD